VPWDQTQFTNSIYSLLFSSPNSQRFERSWLLVFGDLRCEPLEGFILLVLDIREAISKVWFFFVFFNNRYQVSFLNHSFVVKFLRTCASLKVFNCYYHSDFWICFRCLNVVIDLIKTLQWYQSHCFGFNSKDVST